ncbi:hypothetical protein [Labrenzia sp. PHM005]|uniref:hypothetical protein n=1 Tax=Labrenzia sp. PHM005 TaxID=2590016 RepID=UPI0011401F5D|nr:hypothetical protein [Labrenzia sp. PHM005]QDG77151.1 hypothetical protein FJ695_15430 [Labrenzia sp. PHM005]
MTNEPSTILSHLLRGVATDDVETIRDSWRGLLQDKCGSEAVVRRKLQTDAWEKKPSGPIAKYFGVLLALLHELDTVSFRKEIRRLSITDLNPHHRLTLKVLSLRCGDAAATRIGPDVPVFISDEIENKSEIIKKLEKWGQTRDLDLKDVTRVDVVASHPQLDYLGLYNLPFSGVILAWPSDEKVRGISLWWRNFLVEKTFYHEVGCHACGHLEGGQVPEQEREADRYASKMMQNSRPITVRTIRFVFWPLIYYWKFNKR